MKSFKLPFSCLLLTSRCTLVSTGCRFWSFWHTHRKAQCQTISFLVPKIWMHMLPEGKLIRLCFPHITLLHIWCKLSSRFGGGVRGIFSGPLITANLKRIKLRRLKNWDTDMCPGAQRGVFGKFSFGPDTKNEKGDTIFSTTSEVRRERTRAEGCREAT